MPHPLSVALFATLLIASPSLAEDKPWAEAKRIIETATEEVKKNRDAFEKANEKPLEEARRALQELASRLAKEGDTSGATAVLKRIETLKTDVLGKPSPTTPRPPAPVVEKPAPQKPLLKRMAGKWRKSETEVVVIRDNTLQQTNGVNAQLTLIAPDIVEARFDAGWKWHLHMFRDDMIAVREWTAKGEPTSGIVLERIE